MNSFNSNNEFSPVDEYNPTPKVSGYELTDYVAMKERLFFAEYGDMTLNDILDDYQISPIDNRSISNIKLLYRRMQNSFAFHMFDDIDFLECPIGGMYETPDGEILYAISDILTEPTYFCSCCGDINEPKFVISMDDTLITFKTVRCHSSEQYETTKYRKVKDLLPVIEDYKMNIIDEVI